MPDLRKKQREKREHAIIEATKKLIGEKGYRETSIEEIAAAAEVGPATIYNYYGSKSGLMLSIMEQEAESLLAAGEKVIGNPPAGAEDAVYSLIETYFEVFVRHFSKRLMREVMVIFLIEQLSIRKKMLGLDYVMMEQVARILNICRERGQIRADLEIARASLTIYSLVMSDAIAFVVDDDMALKTFFGLIKSQIYLLFQGFAPR